MEEKYKGRGEGQGQRGAEEGGEQKIMGSLQDSHASNVGQHTHFFFQQVGVGFGGKINLS